MSSAHNDEPARQRIRSSLDESLLVEAAAGTGKTTVLVARLVAVLERGKTTVDRIAAVTFTRKAAGELKLRLRQELDRARSATDDDEARRCLEAALARLEEAHIGTIHSFCAELLRARPVEAGIDPDFTEIDDDEASRLYDRAFQTWIEQRLDEMPPGLRRALLRLAHSRGADRSPPLERLREAGRSLVDWRDFPAPWRRSEGFGRDAEIERLMERVEELADLFARCKNPHDYLKKALEPAARLTESIQRSESVAERDFDELEAQISALLRQLTRNLGWKGRGRWFAPEVPREDVLERRRAIVEELETFRAHADADLAALLRRELEEVIAGYEERKRKTGRLDFLDLLLRARDLVRDDAGVRRFFQQRFSHLFVDEFQDTDPLQAEILLLLCADDPEESDWRRVRPVPGKLFLVGDPKQSIYRFRRADVVLYRDVQRQLAERGVGLVHLSKSFRAVAPLQHAINAAFAEQMTGDEASGQPDYIPLDPYREPAAGQPQLVALPAHAPYGFSRIAKTRIEACLPEDVGAFVAWLVERSGWQVEDPEERGRRIPIAPRHVALLFRRFLSWGKDITGGYVGSLEARGIPHVLVGGRSFHQREEVETLRAALTAVEWPDDRLAVFATLRGSLFAIPDNLLLRFRAEDHRLHPFAPRPEDPEGVFGPIAGVLDLLAKLHRERNRVPIVDTLHRLLEFTRAHAGLALRPAGSQVLANVQRVCDLARSFEVRGGVSFRGFVERLDALAERPGAAHSPVLEEGAEGVRIMTAHAAKGLEFPVVVLADITANLSSREPSRFIDAGRGLSAAKLLGCAPWELLENRELELARDRAEGVRLAYVAATRARDLLVVPAVGTGPWEGGWVSPLGAALYPERDSYDAARTAPGCPPFGAVTVLTPPQNGPPEPNMRPGLHRPVAGSHEVVWWDPRALELDVESHFGLSDEVLRKEILSPEDGGAAAQGTHRYERWREARERALARGATPQLEVVAVTEHDRPPPGFVAEISIEILPRAAGRPAGTRFGSLVHTLLRDVAFDADSGAVRALAELHGRLAGATDAEAAAAAGSVAAALAHPLLRQATAAARCHRETPFLLRLEDASMVEGTLDLTFLDQDGTWVVVDFKTDTDLGAAAERYRQQVQWYVYAMATLHDAPARGVLLGV